MPGLDSWSEGLEFVALATPAWLTFLLASMVVTTSGRLRRGLHLLLFWSPPLTWLLASLIVEVAYPSGESGGPNEPNLASMGNLFVRYLRRVCRFPRVGGVLGGGRRV